MWRVWVAALFAASLVVGMVGCGEEEPPPPPPKKTGVVEGIVKQAGDAATKAAGEVTKGVEEAVKKAVEEKKEDK